MTVWELRVTIEKVKSLRNPFEGQSLEEQASFEECRREIIKILTDELSGMFLGLEAQQRQAEDFLEELKEEYAE